MPDEKRETHSQGQDARGAAAPGSIPDRGAAVSPLAAAFSLGEFIRAEHGTAGLKRFLLSLNPLLPYDMIQQLAAKYAMPAPPKPPEPVIPQTVEKQEKPAGMSPEQLMLLMNALNGGQSGGLDPALLMKLMQK